MVSEQQNRYAIVGESELKLEIVYKDDEFDKAKMDFYGIGTGTWRGASATSQDQLEKSLDEISTYALDALLFVKRARKESRELKERHILAAAKREAK